MAVSAYRRPTSRDLDHLLVHLSVRLTHSGRLFQSYRGDVQKSQGVLTDDCVVDPRYLLVMETSGVLDVGRFPLQWGK
jgi:hypothetical protein